MLFRSRVADVDRHELMEQFDVGGERLFYPDHGPGGDPYRVTQRTAEPDLPPVRPLRGFMGPEALRLALDEWLPPDAFAELIGRSVHVEQDGLPGTFQLTGVEISEGRRSIHWQADLCLPAAPKFGTVRDGLLTILGLEL